MDEQTRSDRAEHDDSHPRTGAPSEHPDEHVDAADLESFGDAQADDVLHQLISEELGESIAELMRQMRRVHEAWRRRIQPEEGLRERKRRITRQLISDAAT